MTKPALAPAAPVALETDPHKHRDRRLHRQAKPAPIPSSAPPPPQPSVLISKEFFDGGRRLPSLVQQSSTARAARSDFSDVKSHLEAVSSQSSPTRSPRKPTAMQILKGTRRDDDDLVMISSLRRSKAVTWSDQSPVSRTPRRTHRPRQHRGSPSPSSLVLSSADGSFEV